MAFIKRIAGTAALLIVCSLFVSSAKAAYIVTLEQQGSDVVASGSGTIDLTDLTIVGSFPNNAHMRPAAGFIVTGPTSVENTSVYTGLSPIFSFGSGPPIGGPGIDADTGSGDMVGILEPGPLVFNPGESLFVLPTYVSGAPLLDIATYFNETFSSLGVTPGTYTSTWGTGVHADSFTLQIGPAAAPEPSSLLLLAGALTGFLLVCASRCKIAKI